MVNFRKPSLSFLSTYEENRFSKKHCVGGMIISPLWGSDDKNLGESFDWREGA